MRVNAVIRVQWAVREAKGTDSPVCLFPPQAKFTACGARVYRDRSDPTRAISRLHNTWRPTTFEPLRTSCRFCREMLRRTLYSGAPEEELQAKYARLFRAEKNRSEGGGPFYADRSYTPPKIKTASVRRSIAH